MSNDPVLILSGAKPYQVIWIKYFTQKTTIQALKGNELTPIDHFLNMQNFIPVDNKIVTRELQQCHSSTEVSNKLTELFGLKKVNFLNNCIMAQTALDQFNKQLKSKNSSLIPSFVFRGFIAISSQLNEELNCVANNKTGLFQEQVWPILNIPLEFLLNCGDEELISELVLCLEPMFDSFLNHSQFILELDNDNEIYKAFVKFLNLIIFIKGNQKSIPYFNFLIGVMDIWLQKKDNISENDPLYDVFDFFIFSLFGIIDKIKIHQKRNFAFNLANYLTKCCKYKKDNDETLKKGVKILKLLSLLVESFDEDCAVVVSISLFSFVEKILTKYQFKDEIENDSSLEYNEPLKFYNCIDDYIKEHITQEIPKTFSFKNEILNELVSYIGEFFDVDFPNPCSLSLLNHFIEKVTNINQIDELLQITYLLISGLMLTCKLPLESSLMIIKYMVYKGIYAIDINSAKSNLQIKLCYLSTGFILKCINNDSNVLSPFLSMLTDLTNGSSFPIIYWFMPLFRVLLISNNDFINKFISSGIIDNLSPFLNDEKYQMQIDSLVSFLQIIILLNPYKFYNSLTLPALIIQMLLIERYNFLLPCLSIGLNISSQVGFVKAKPIILNIILLLTSIFRQNENSKEYHKISNLFIEIISESIQSFNKEIIEEIIKQKFFITVSKLPKVTKTPETLLLVIRLYTSVTIRFPNLIHLFIQSMSIFSNLKKAFCDIKITHEIAEALFSFAMNKQTKLHFYSLPIIQNRAALELLLDVSNDTEIEELLLKDLCHLCKGSTSNVLECFHIDCIHYALEKAKKPKLRKSALELFKVIGSLFFSPFSFNDLFKTLLSYNEETRNSYHQSIIKAFTRLISEESQIPINCFFHFNGFQSGIFGPSISSNFLNQPWTFLTTFCLDTETSNEDSLLLFTEDNNSILYFYFSNGDLHMIRKEQNEYFSAQFNVKISRNKWYQIMIVNSGKEVSLYIDQKKVGLIKIPKFEFFKNCLVRIGNSQENAFSGDIGPIYIFDTDNVEHILSEYNKKCNSHIRLKNSICFYDPVNTNEDEINYVTNESAILVGNAVDFCTTVKNVVQYDNAFHLILPLFTIINTKYVDENQEDELFHSLLLLLKILLSLSPNMENLFESIGGFKLLIGIFQQINPNNFNLIIPQDLEDIFNDLKSTSLKKQMAEYLWLNYDFFSRYSSFFQINVYNILSKIIKCNEEYFNMDPFFLLFQICSDIINSNKIILKPESEFPSSLINKKISDFEIDEIKTLQFQCFQNIFSQCTTQSTIIILIMIIFYHQNKVVKDIAYQIIENLLIKENNEIIIALSVIHYYQIFLYQFQTGNKDNKIYSLNLIYLLGLLEKKKKIEIHQNISISKAPTLIISILEKESTDFDELITILWSLIYKNGEFYCTEFFNLLCYCSQFVKSQSLFDSIYKYLTDCDFKTFTNYYQQTKSWPFWIFLISNCSQSPLLFYSKMIIHNYNYGNGNALKTILMFLNYVGIAFKVEIFPYISNLFSLFIKDFLMNESDTTKQYFLNLIIREIFITYDVGERTPCQRFPTETTDKLRELLINYIKPRINLIYQIHYDIELFDLLIKLLEKDPLLIIQFTKDVSFYSFTLYSIFVSIQLQSMQTQKKSLFESYINVASQIYGKIDKTIFVEAISFVIIEAKKEISDYELFVIKFVDIIREIPDFDVLSNNLSAKIQNIIQSDRPNILRTLYEEINNISLSLQEFENEKKLIDPSINNEFYGYYDRSFSYELKLRAISERYNSKLATSYIREVTSDGMSFENIKWKWRNKVDSTFRNVFWKINRHFNQHKKASAIRDSLPYSDILSQQEIIPYKEILENSTGNVKKFQTLASFSVTCITLLSQFVGILHVSNSNILFDGTEQFDGFGTPIAENKSKKNKIIDIPISNFGFILSKKHLLIDNSCEIYTNQNKSYFFVFNSTEERQEFYINVKKGYKNNDIKQKNAEFDFFRACRKVCGTIYQNIPSCEIVVKTKITEKWQNHVVSTFEYLFFLNLLSGRSLNDLSQYPVYPWIFKDYKSNQIDLNNPEVYRDFSIPVGAMDNERLKILNNLLNVYQDEVEKCLYRTHYSNAASVIGFLLRTEPFTSLHIILQDGKFDHADRLFYSIPNAFDSVSTALNDYRELIPQFFCDFHFLKNENNFDLGKTLNKFVVNDVILPNWAATPLEFIGKQRQGLEGDYVSQHIHEWINLIFGIYQKSYEKNNVFHMFSYYDCVNSHLINNDKILFKMAQHHSANFGICPEKLFHTLHPKRNDNLRPITSILNPNLVFEYQKDDLLLLKDQFVLSSQGNNTLLTNISSSLVTKINLKIKKQHIKSITLSNQHSILILIPTGCAYASVYNYSLMNEVTILSQKIGSISCSANINDKYFVTGGTDCSISIYEFPFMNLISTLSVQSLPVICIAGEISLDLLVSIDGKHNVYCSSIERKRLLFTFSIDCQYKSLHSLLVLKNSLIVISSSFPENKSGVISFYDTLGNNLGNIYVYGHVIKMIPLYPNDYSIYIVVTLETKKIIIIDATTLSIISKDITFNIDPNFVSVHSPNKEIIFVKNNNGNLIVDSTKF